MKLQSPDNNWDNWKIFDDLRTDPGLDAAVQAVGYHYLSDWFPKLENDVHAVPPKVKATGKPLWVSEEYSLSGRTWQSAILAARLINKYYIREQGHQVRNLVSRQQHLRRQPACSQTGLMRANTPWSGHYEVWPAVWAVAHTTQFAEPGWRYMDHACGRFDAKTWRGSYVALRDPATGDWSLIICTDKAVDVTVRIGGGLKQRRYTCGSLRRLCSLPNRTRHSLRTGFSTWRWPPCCLLADNDHRPAQGDACGASSSPPFPVSLQGGLRELSAR